MGRSHLRLLQGGQGESSSTDRPVPLATSVDGLAVEVFASAERHLEHHPQLAETVRRTVVVAYATVIEMETRSRDSGLREEDLVAQLSAQLNRLGGWVALLENGAVVAPGDLQEVKNRLAAARASLAAHRSGGKACR